MNPFSEPIRLAVFDLDGTIIGVSDKEVPAVIGSAFRRAAERGVRVTLATGRAFSFTRPLADSLGLTTPLICYQGAVIQAMDGRVLHDLRFDPATLRPALELARARDWQFYLEAAGVLYLETGRHYDDALFTIHTLPVCRVPDMLAAQPRPHQFSVFGPDGIGEDDVAALQAAFGPAVTVMRTHHHFINAIPAGVSKGSAVAWLASELNIPRTAVMAVGDSDNDVSMVEWAGLGVAMGGARPAVLAVADWVAPPLAEHGAAAALERFVLNGGERPV